MEVAVRIQNMGKKGERIGWMVMMFCFCVLTTATMLRWGRIGCSSRPGPIWCDHRSVISSDRRQKRDVKFIKYKYVYRDRTSSYDTQGRQKRAESRAGFNKVTPKLLLFYSLNSCQGRIRKRRVYYSVYVRINIAWQQNKTRALYSVYCNWCFIW